MHSLPIAAVFSLPAISAVRSQTAALTEALATCAWRVHVGSDETYSTPITMNCMHFKGQSQLFAESALSWLCRIGGAAH